MWLDLCRAVLRLAWGAVIARERVVPLVIPVGPAFAVWDECLGHGDLRESSMPARWTVCLQGLRCAGRAEFFPLGHPIAHRAPCDGDDDSSDSAGRSIHARSLGHMRVAPFKDLLLHCPVF